MTIIVDMRSILENYFLAPPYVTLRFDMKVAIADYLWGRIWFYQYLKTTARHHFMKSNWHYISKIEDLVPKGSISYKQFLVHPKPEHITACPNHTSVEEYRDKLKKVCSKARSNTYADSLWMLACNRTKFEADELCKIYWMAPFVDEFFHELIINVGQMQLLSAEIIWDMVYMSDSTHLFSSYGASFRKFLEPINFSQINHYLSRKAVPKEIWVMWTKMKELLNFDTEKPMDYRRAAKTVNYVSRAIWECSRKSAWMTTECATRSESKTYFAVVLSEIHLLFIVTDPDSLQAHTHSQFNRGSQVYSRIFYGFTYSAF